VIGMILISRLEYKNSVNPKGLEVDSSMFKPRPGFIVGSVLIVGILVALYTVFW
jgi:SSS family solute:Na+ symporter